MTTIAAAEKNKSVTYNINLESTKDPMTTVYTMDGSSLEATWDAHIGFPMNVLGPLFSWNVKKTLVSGMNNLVSLANSRHKEGVYNNYQINLVDVPEMYYVTNRSEINSDNIQQFYSQNLSGLFRALQEANVETIGPDCALIYKYDPATMTTDIAAALPVPEDVAIPNCTTVVLPRANAITVDYYGNRAESQPAHDALQAYMQDRELVASVPVIEEYVTDVLEEKDPNKWLTKITYRIVD
jgi:effector-binding domain-containing protein